MRLAAFSKFDRSFFAILVATAFLSFFIFGKWEVPIAIWLLPIFVMRLCRRYSLVGMIAADIALTIPVLIASRGMGLFCNYLDYFVIAFGCQLIWFAFLLDALFSKRFSSFFSTLVFPITITIIEFLSKTINPFIGTGPSLTLDQYRNLVLIQMLSFCGMSGLCFLIFWPASIINSFWEKGFFDKKVQKTALIYGAIFISVLFGGGLRLALWAPQEKTVRIASIAVSEKTLAPVVELAKTGKSAFEFRDLYRKVMSPNILADLLKLTRQEAKAGSKIVFWSETAVPSFKEDENSYIAQGQKLAKEENIYLGMPLKVFVEPQGPIYENKFVFIGPDGKIIFTYFMQNRPFPFEVKYSVVPESEKNYKLKYTDTPYGRIGVALCFDMSFPRFMRQAGMADVDILLVLSGDTRAITERSSAQVIFRSIENGMSIVKLAITGYSLAVDYQGHTVSFIDYFSVPDDARIMVSNVPIKGVTTIYSKIGDLFLCFCVGFFICGVVYLIRSRP